MTAPGVPVGQTASKRAAHGQELGSAGASRQQPISATLPPSSASAAASPAGSQYTERGSGSSGHHSQAALRGSGATEAAPGFAATGAGDSSALETLSEQGLRDRLGACGWWKFCEKGVADSVVQLCVDAGPQQGLALCLLEDLRVSTAAPWPGLCGTEARVYGVCVTTAPPFAGGA